VQYNTNVQTARSISEAYQQHHLPDGASNLPEKWKKISIGNLNFSHKESYSSEEKAQSLHHISINIEKGQTRCPDRGERKLQKHTHGLAARVV
ncbi:MAG: hypothetical protein ACK5SJ_15440, partial [Bacteroidota bacterium]